MLLTWQNSRGRWSNHSVQFWFHFFRGFTSTGGKNFHWLCWSLILLLLLLMNITDANVLTVIRFLASLSLICSCKKICVDDGSNRTLRTAKIMIVLLLWFSYCSGAVENRPTLARRLLSAILHVEGSTIDAYSVCQLFLHLELKIYFMPYHLLTSRLPNVPATAHFLPTYLCEWLKSNASYAGTPNSTPVGLSGSRDPFPQAARTQHGFTTVLNSFLSIARFH